jgi:4-hydroxy-tetrahydrodipicolinate reductase
VIRVGVFGAGGRMGATVCRAVLDDPDLELVAAVDPERAGIDLDQLGVRGTDLHVSAKPDAMKKAGVEVAVDFTIVDAARENLRYCAANRIHAVVGTTGFTAHDLEGFREEFAPGRVNAVIAPNFAIGAVLMMRFAEMAAPHFDTAEVIEYHHDAKADAPSGTAMLTAERMAAASGDWATDPTTNEVLPGARGGAGPSDVRVHSVRMRGVVANQEVILGTTGQTLTIRHDTTDRTSFMPGVLLAIKAVTGRPGLTVGLDALLDLL